jgi:hypothetical protein
LESTQLGQTISGAPVLIGIAIPFLVAFSINPRNHWWALIPAWVMFSLTLVILFEDRVDSYIISAFVLYSIALPFLVVYLLDRSRHWALILFAALSVVGLIPLIENFVGGAVVGLIPMFLFALAFFVVYFWSRSNWWALIPAGVFASIELVVLLNYSSYPLFRKNSFNPLGTAVLLGGFGLTFGVLWLLRSSHPTEWTKYPALVLFAVAVMAFFIGTNFQFFWPVILIAAGIIILLFSFLKRSSSTVKK